eukprot:817757-Prorocentrum_minimum.AAC.1
MERLNVMTAPRPNIPHDYSHYSHTHTHTGEQPGGACASNGDWVRVRERVSAAGGAPPPLHLHAGGSQRVRRAAGTQARGAGGPRQRGPLPRLLRQRGGPNRTTRVRPGGIYPTRGPIAPLVRGLGEYTRHGDYLHERQGGMHLGWRLPISRMSATLPVCGLFHRLGYIRCYPSASDPLPAPLQTPPDPSRPLQTPPDPSRPLQTSPDPSRPLPTPFRSPSDLLPTSSRPPLTPF